MEREQARYSWRCRCIWIGGRCPNRVTQEDGLCDWCGTRRSEDMADNPNYDPVSDTLGGAGQLHDSFDPNQRPPACWYPNSGRTLADDAARAKNGQYRRPGEAARKYRGPVVDLQVEESFVTSSGIAHNCRLWGVVEDMPCEFGCRVTPRMLTTEEGRVFLRRAAQISGDAIITTRGSLPERLARVQRRSRAMRGLDGPNIVIDSESRIVGRDRS